MVEENRFIIVSPNYNGAEFLQKNRESVLNQDYSGEIHQVYVDDASTDKSVEVISKLPGKCSLIQKSQRMGCPHSHLLPFLNMDLNPLDIIVHLDADDWFYDSGVLSHINNVYNETGCFMTYGNYESTDGSPSVCKPMEDSNFRSKIVDGGWCFSHLRTFRKMLVDKIPFTYILDNNGHLMSHAADVVFFLPMMEYAGRKRIQFVDRLNVVYNRHRNNEDANSDGLQRQVYCAIASSKKANNER